MNYKHHSKSNASHFITESQNQWIALIQFCILPYSILFYTCPLPEQCQQVSMWAHPEQEGFHKHYGEHYPKELLTWFKTLKSFSCFKIIIPVNSDLKTASGTQRSPFLVLSLGPECLTKTLAIFLTNTCTSLIVGVQHNSVFCYPLHCLQKETHIFANKDFSMLTSKHI